jgi:hypothetical protein
MRPRNILRMALTDFSNFPYRVLPHVQMWNDDPYKTNPRVYSSQAKRKWFYEQCVFVVIYSKWWRFEYSFRLSRNIWSSPKRHGVDLYELQRWYTYIYRAITFQYMYYARSHIFSLAFSISLRWVIYSPISFLIRCLSLPHPNKHRHSVSEDVTSMKREAATYDPKI